ncbi:MAG: glycosyltransferase, partial [candidate division WOR-3 bacterium]
KGFFYDIDFNGKTLRDEDLKEIEKECYKIIESNYYTKREEWDYNYAKELNVENRVFYLGFQKNPYKYLKNCFALVLPSEFEGFGLVFYEAMALGIPIVGSGIKETFGENNKYGIYANSVEEIVNAIKLLENQEIYNYYKKIGMERVKEFELEKIAKEYEKVILSIL